MSTPGSGFQQNLMVKAEAEMLRWGERMIVLEMDLPTAMGVIGALQLALRHPGFASGPVSKLVREFVFNFEKQIPPEYPAIRELIKLGFHKRFDS